MKELSECNVLIVDDVKSNIDILVEGLKADYKLSIATSGEAALRSVEANPPDLILLDIMMPGMDGFEVCRTLKTDGSAGDIPIMFLSALGEVESKTTGFAIGGSDYLTKPFEMLEVKARVRSLLKAKIYSDYMVDYQKTLEREVAKRTAQLRIAKDQVSKSFIETIFRLAIAAEFKDSDTGAHILRIGHYASAMAKQLVEDEEFCESLVYAAPLHDIGKIGIPDSVLLKPGNLTDDEWDLMRRHTIFGGTILDDSRSKIINLGKSIALTHHEKWDGTGYPNGIAGEDIPLAGRIVAIVDVFDALVSKRCYKDAITPETAMQFIEAGNGKHFDPRLVESLNSIFDEIMQIRHNFQDGDESLLQRHFSIIFEEETPQDEILLHERDET